MTLKDDILSATPMRLDHYIETCLWDDTHGYYSTRDVFGAKGDFITAPEISQIFGEIIGIWVHSKWVEIGRPKRFTLLELGAGRGVLMRDILRMSNIDDAFALAISPVILEKSSKLQMLQTQNVGAEIRFINSLDDIENQPIIIIANEFFDALPIRQFRFEDGGWLEAYVSAQFTKIWKPCLVPPVMLASKMTAGVTIEINESSYQFCSQIGVILRAQKGAFICLDYGDFDGFGDTLQAIKSHKYVSPFSNFGEADLTAHVRFGDLARASNLIPSFTTQGEFLKAYGGDDRLKSLCTKNPSLVESLTSGYHRLTSPDEMGELFKVLILEKLG